jgi:hypothetical protein
MNTRVSAVLTPRNAGKGERKAMPLRLFGIMVRTETSGPQQSQSSLREIAAVFMSPEGLEAAVNELASNGWDRADMSLLAQEHVFSGDVAALVQDTHRTADDPTAPRAPVVSDTDVRQGRTLATSLAGAMAALVASGATILTGGGALAAVVGAAVAGGGASVLVNAVGRRASGTRDDFLHEQIARGGIVLWAALRDPPDESLARMILQRHGATDVHVHEGPA